MKILSMVRKWGSLWKYSANPIKAWSLSLRIPIAYIQSTTHASWSDETHGTIRRTFTPPHAPHTKRHFCGFCGISLTSWSEKPEADADWVHVNLRTLKRGSVEKLFDEGVFTASLTDQRARGGSEEKGSKDTPDSEGYLVRGAHWYDDMIDGSELSRIKRRRGGQTSTDGRSRVDWEIIEFTEEPKETGGSTGKRKLEELGKEVNVQMRD